MLFTEIEKSDIPAQTRGATGGKAQTIVNEFLAAEIPSAEVNTDEVGVTSNEQLSALAGQINTKARDRFSPIEAVTRSVPTGDLEQDDDGRAVEVRARHLYLVRLDMDAEGNPIDVDLQEYFDSKKRNVKSNGK